MYLEFFPFSPLDKLLNSDLSKDLLFKINEIILGWNRQILKQYILHNLPLLYLKTASISN